MNLAQILRHRLRNQQLIESTCGSAIDVVSRLGAMQAQDYPAVQWAIALRANGVTADDIDAALDRGTVIRTHLLRPTWHLVNAADVRWMLALTAPRIRRGMAGYFRKLDLDARMLAKSRRVIARAVAGRSSTRSELTDALQRARIPVDGLRPTFLVLDAELEGILCSGPRRGRHMTFGLLDERVPPSPSLPRNEALARLAMVYLAGHAPASAHDFAWWAGLTVGEARSAIAANGALVERESIARREYWYLPTRTAGGRARRGPCVHLLPNFDEYLVAYRDRAPITGGCASRLALSRADLLSYRVIVDGIVSGAWKRVIERECVRIEVTLAESVAPAAERAIARVASAYGTFLHRRVDLTIRSHAR